MKPKDDFSTKSCEVNLTDDVQTLMGIHDSIESGIRLTDANVIEKSELAITLLSMQNRTWRFPSDNQNTFHSDGV